MKLILFSRTAFLSLFFVLITIHMGHFATAATGELYIDYRQVLNTKNNAAIHITAFNADGTKGSVAVRNLPQNPQGFGVQGGTNVEIEHINGKSEAIVMDFNGMEAGSVAVILAWRSRKESANVEFLKDGKEVYSMDISGSGDTKNGIKRMLTPPSGKSFNALRFTAPYKGDDYLIHALWVYPKITAETMTSFKNLEELKDLLLSGGDVNAVSAYNDTPLIQAARLKDSEAIGLLLQKGASPNIKNRNGDTALSILYDNTPTAHEEWRKCVAMLETAGAVQGREISPKDAGLISYTIEKNTLDTYEPTHNFYQDDFWRVATLEDVKQSFIKALEHKVSQPDKDARGRTILSIAAAHSEDPNIVDFIADQFPYLEEQDIIAAAQNPNPKVLKVLIDRVSLGYEDGFFKVAARMAGQANLGENLRLISKRAPEVLFYGKYPGTYLSEHIYPTVGRPDRKKVRQVLRSIPKKYGKDHFFFTELGPETTLGEVRYQRAITQGSDFDMNSTFEWGYGEGFGYNGDTILEYALRELNTLQPEVIEFLVEEGATITPKAMRAASDITTMKTFLKLGAKLNAVTDFDDHIMQQSFMFGDPEYVEFLLKEGALPDIKDKMGNTALDLIYSQYRPSGDDNSIELGGNDAAIVELLKAAGAKPGKGRTPQEAGLITYKIQKNTLTSYTHEHNFHEPDFWRLANLKDVRQSFLQGENLNDFSIEDKEDPNYGKSTILAKAVLQSPHLAIIQFLVENGAQIGPAAVVNAAINSNIAILKYLIAQGGDVNSESTYTAVGAAAAAGLKEHMVFLMEKGADVDISPYLVGNALCFAKDNYFRPDRKALVKILEDAGAWEHCGTN